MEILLVYLRVLNITYSFILLTSVCEFSLIFKHIYANYRYTLAQWFMIEVPKKGYKINLKGLMTINRSGKQKNIFLPQGVFFRLSFNLLIFVSIILQYKRYLSGFNRSIYF